MMSDTRRRWRSIIMGCVGCWVAMACTDLSAPLPSGTIDPGTVKNAAGAAGMYIAAVEAFQSAWAQSIVISGLMTDELQVQANSPSAAGMSNVDSRRFSNDGNVQILYEELHGVRTLTAQAIGALSEYDAENSGARRGELYAMKGYAELLLADFFCSGVPLSTYDFEKDFTYHQSSTTDEVYQHAIALFDTAIVLGTDSVPVLNLARVGKGRAQLALGQYEAAKTAVEDVPTDFRFVESMLTCSEYQTSSCGIDTATHGTSFQILNGGTVANQEAGTGLPFLTQPDPRVAVTGTMVSPVLNYLPTKYPLGKASILVVASGIEARLITAEADLHAEHINAWYTALRELRTTGTYTSVDTTFGGSQGDSVVAVDTAWMAGTGGVAGIPPLQPDPGLSPPIGQDAADVRLDLLFRERAYWLFVDGHRQGDLRRLVRQYHRSKADVYPWGSYPGPGSGLYAPEIDLPISSAENNNPLFHGCLNRD